MKKIKWIEIEIYAGTSILDAKLEAVECVIKYSKPVSFKFNGVRYLVDPFDVSSTVKEIA